MNIEQETRLRPELGKDEKFLWTGAPKTGIVFHRMDIFLVPFTAVWFGGALTFFLVATLQSRSVPLSIFSLAFVAVGSYLFAGRFIYDAWRRKKTVYGVTTERIIIRTEGATTSVKSFNIKLLTDMSLSERKDGTGSIQLAAGNNPFAFAGNASWPGVKKPPILESIPGVRRVYNLILEQQRK